MPFGGRLTLSSGKPVMDGDVTSSTLYYTQHCGDKVSIGGSDYSFSELSLSLSGLSANAIHDVFVGLSGGAPYLFTGSAWTGAGDIAITPVSTITTGTGANAWLRSTAAFDGTVSKSAGSAARNSASNAGVANYLGQDWSTPKSVSRVIIWGPYDDYMRGDATHNLPVTLDGWDGSSWVNLYTGYLDASASVYGVPLSFTHLPRKAYSMHRVGFGGNGANAVNIAQIKFYEDGSRTSALARNNGILTENGNTGSYLGTIHIDATAGQCTAHSTYGPSRKFGVWNAYNQQPIILQAGIPCPSSLPWSYTPTGQYPAWDAIKSDMGNSLSVLSGLPQTVETNLQVAKYMTATGNAPATSSQYTCAIGWNHTSVADSTWASATLEPTAATCATGEMSNIKYIPPPVEGVGFAMALENHNNTVKAWSGKRDMMLSARWLG